MRRAEYHFESVWEMAGPVATVFDALRDYERYPTWWPDVRSVHQIEPGDEDGTGMVVRYVVASPLGYALAFDVTLARLDPPRLISTRSSGDLVGTGDWILSEAAGITTATYVWNVATTPRWMNLVAPLARPLFSWAHARVMRRGARGLTDHLSVDLLSSR